jgi:polyisoprenoid-binding protein YceI
LLGKKGFSTTSGRFTKWHSCITMRENPKLIEAVSEEEASFCT